MTGRVAAALLVLMLPAAAQTFPEGEGREIFELICSSCHDPKVVLTKRWTREEWQRKVTEMLQEEIDVTQKEHEAIVAYLAKAFPKRLNVNTSTAKDIERILELTGVDASAIVSHRQEKGPFKTVDEVKQVPGLDAAAIEARRDRFEF